MTRGTLARVAEPLVMAGVREELPSGETLYSVRGTIALVKDTLFLVTEADTLDDWVAGVSPGVPGHLTVRRSNLEPL